MEVREFETADIVLYESDGLPVPIEVRYIDESFWLTQQELADLFGVDRTVISRHLINIESDGELPVNSICAKIAHIGSNGKIYKTTIYNLDVIIAVGYRVNSIKATKFRQWATATLKEFIVKGFVLNDELLKNGKPFGKDYFDELLVRIRDIRASERRVYQKITDIFQECSFDYDSTSDAAKTFYATVQNKLHFAITGMTAAEIIYQRADSNRPNMGLTTWRGGPEGRIHSSDIIVAKNYLSEEELSKLNRLVTMFLDTVELRAENHRLLSMSDCNELLTSFLAFNGEQVLENKGCISKKSADSKAKKEFSQYQRDFDKTYQNDFEKKLGRWQKP